MKNLLVLSLLFLSGCVVVIGGSRHRGSGHRAERSRQLEPFSAVVLDTAAQVTVRVGPAPAVTYSCDEELLDLLRFRVSGDVLTVDFREPVDLRAPLRLVLSTPHLERLEVDGAADVHLAGVKGSRLSVAVDGAADVDAEGAVDLVDVRIDGAANVGLGALQAREARVDIDGSGAVVVNASEAVTYVIDGSGDIRYVGSPAVTGSISGAGSVRRR